MPPSSDHPERDATGLFARARSGDQAAWEELFNTCYPKVIRVVRRKLDRPLRSLYDSTDFASDVMKSLAANLDRLDFPSIDSLMAFLAQVAEQKVIDEYRRRHTLKRDICPRVQADIRATAPAEAAGWPRPTRPRARSRRPRVRERLLAGQDEARAAVIELKWQGYDNAEIAVQTGWNLRRSNGSSKNLHERCRRSGENLMPNRCSPRSATSGGPTASTGGVLRARSASGSSASPVSIAHWSRCQAGGAVRSRCLASWSRPTCAAVTTGASAEPSPSTSSSSPALRERVIGS